MSCQQASKLITTATTTTAKSIPTKRTVTTTIAAAAVATAAGAQTPPVAKSSTATAKITKTTPTASKVEVVDVENIGVAATTKTNTFEDPYVFTETITATPPILFNAQKSRARLSEAQHSRNTNNKNNNNKQQRAGNKKSSIVAAAAASHIAQLNGTTTTAALAKAQASLGAAVASAAATTNFNNVTQSQRQPASQQTQQLQLQSPLQLQSQASPKRATNVCVVRPQQQQQQKQQQQQQQQQQQLKQQQQAKLITKNGAPQPSPPPPPLYPHTPSLWQTPLILDTTQKQQPQPQQQTNIVVATALVSPPTSPASLPSPTASNSAATPTAAVTAMVSPIVSPPKGGGSLPPSKFHHTTLAQHFAKVECLKKKKSLPLACQSSNNNNNTIVAQTQVSRGAYHLTHPPPLTVFNTTTTATTPAAAAAAMKKHSADAAIDDSNDLNEIPVNVIFRKPPELLSGQTPPRSALLKLGAVAPLAPPMPLAAAANAVCPRLPAATVTSINNAPALITQEAALGAAASVPAVAAAPIASIQNDQMSSKVANSAVTLAAAAVPKRKSTAAAGSLSSRKGNKQIAKNSAQEAPPPSLPTQVAVSSPLPPTPPQSEAPPTRRRKATAPASKRPAALLITENEPLDNDVPYGLQKHWLPADASRQLGLDQPAAAANIRDREERIAMRKGLLRHQALQLLSTRKLQEAPLTAARQRLQSVQSLLLKYQDTASQQQGIGVGNRCLVVDCKEPTLSMAAHCERHIVQNTTQQLFQPCVAWRVDGTVCQAPVFDVLHTLALCPVHSHLRAGLELQQPRKQQLTSKTAPTPAVPGPVPAIAGAVITPAVVNKRKRKTNPNANPVGRPQKRAKKPDAAITPTINTTTLPSRPPMSAVMQRKSSTTSLESIASNSQSSAMSHSALPPYTPTAPVMSSAMPQLSIVPPALAPLSDYQLQQQLLQPKIEPEQQLDLLANFKADEISQIVAQLAAASSELHHNNNSLHYNNNNNNTYSSNNNSNSGSSSISCGFPSFNAAFGNAMSGQQQPHQQQQPQQQQIGGQLTCNNNTTLDSTQSLLSQHMFGICENSSAYASSEDTGLGGLSESELIGANDADDIALNGAHLLEEHDLVNVFDTFLDDAFNELFQSAQQADCDAAERALENADKNLKCLQPTIGSTDHDSAFLNDLLDVGDDLLVNAVTSVMNSPSTSGIGIDAGTLFVDSSGGGNSTSSNSAIGSSPAASVADIRGLVQT